MNIDIIQLMEIFDELMQDTDEERGTYWFKTIRTDSLIVTLITSIYEEYVSIIIQNTSKIDISSLRMEDCSEIRVLDVKRKCLEILHKNGDGRCFLSLLGSPILKYTDNVNKWL